MIAFLRRLFAKQPMPIHYGIATLDMRGRLRFNVKEALRRGMYAGEIEASRRLGEMLREANEPIPYTITNKGRALLGEGK